MAVTRFPRREFDPDPGEKIPGASTRDFWFLMAIGALVVGAVSVLGYLIAVG